MSVKDTALAWLMPTKTAIHRMTLDHSCLWPRFSPRRWSRYGYSRPMTAAQQYKLHHFHRFLPFGGLWTWTGLTGHQHVFVFTRATLKSSDMLALYKWEYYYYYYYASTGNSDRNVSVCPSVRPSRAGIVSKRRKLAAWFLHHLVAPRL